MGRLLAFVVGYLIFAVISLLIVIVLLRRAPVIEDEEWLARRDKSEKKV